MRLARPLSGVLLLLSIVATGCRAGEPAGSGAVTRAVDLIPVRIKTQKGMHLFHVEVARTPAEQQRGLMYRKSLAPDGGMIFFFDAPERAIFWMKNTYIPLDMLFIRADGSIARIAANTTPFSLEPVDAGEDVTAVIEIAGGRAAAVGIHEGDLVSWSAASG